MKSKIKLHDIVYPQEYLKIPRKNLEFNSRNFARNIRKNDTKIIQNYINASNWITQTLNNKSISVQI